MNKFRKTVMIIFACLIVVSLAANILYIVDFVSEIWFRAAFTASMIGSVLVNLSSLMKKSDAATKVNKASTPLTVIYIFIAIAWVVTYIVALFH